MIDFIDGVLEPALWFLADWSLRWGLLILMFGAWLAIVRPRRAATRYLICLLILLAGLALPGLPRWGKGIAIASARSPTLVVSTKPAENFAASEAERGFLKDSKEEPSDLAPTGGKRTAANEPPSPMELEPRAEPLGTKRIAILSLAIVWMLGVVLLFARRLGGWLLLERIRRTALPVQGNAFQVFQACLARSALRRKATLASHAAVQSPITLGLLRPTILVPRSWTELPEDVQRASLLHELAHLGRYDDWSALAVELVRVGFFFHPVVLWILARIEYERELLCDEMVVAQGVDRREYAGVLLEFSRQTGRLRPALVGPSYPLGFGHRPTVKARINRLLEANMNRWMSPLPARRAIALGAVVLALALGFGSIRIRHIAAADFNRSQTADDAAVSQGDQDSGQKAPQVPDNRAGPSADENYRIEPYHVLKITVVGADADPFLPTPSNYLVEPGGKVDLGPLQGKIAVAGLPLEDAEVAIRNFLEQRGIKRPLVSVTLAGWVTRWLSDPGMKAPYHIKPLHLLKIKVVSVLTDQINIDIDVGSLLIEPSGKISLGPNYGRVTVGGLTLEEAQEAIEKHLQALGYKQHKVSVTLAGWESDWHDLTKQGTRQASQPLPKPGVRSESLSYGNKSFAEWRAVLTIDLKPEVRIDAIKALSTFAPNGYAKQAAEAIIEVMRTYELDPVHSFDKPVIDAAYSAFGKIGAEGVPPLIEELKHGKGNGRRFAISAIAHAGMRRHTKIAAPAVLEAFKDQDFYIRRQALLNATAVDMDRELLVRALIEACKHADPSTRRLAAERLHGMGQDAKPAIPVLIAALKDENLGVRGQALVALRSIKPEPGEVVPALAAATKDKNADIRRNAAEFLGSFGPEAKEAVPALIEAFKDNDNSDRDRTAVVRALGSIGPAAREALPVLLDFIRQDRGNSSLGQEVRKARAMIQG